MRPWMMVFDRFGRMVLLWLVLGIPAMEVYSAAPELKLRLKPVHLKPTQPGVQISGLTSINEFEQPVQIEPEQMALDKPAGRNEQAHSSWIWNPPGEVIAPILLYHHINENQIHPRYVVQVGEFEAQLKNLQAWGYTTVRFSLLVDALVNGAQLPRRPFVITFDDGYQDVYEYAFPVMQRLGMIGVVFVIEDQIGVKGYLNRGQLSELAASGWEIGSHSKTHGNLRSSGVNIYDEIYGTRQNLQAMTGYAIEVFSYPYGLTSDYLRREVEAAGYVAAVGLGGMYRHVSKSRYYLSRIEVTGELRMDNFTQLLPWSGELTYPANSVRLERNEDRMLGFQ